MDSDINVEDVSADTFEVSLEIPPDLDDEFTFDVPVSLFDGLESSHSGFADADTFVDCDEGFELATDATIVKRALNDFRIPEGDDYNMIFNHITSSLSVMNAGNFNGLINTISQMNYSTRPMREVKYAEPPSTVTAISSFYTGGFDFLTAVQDSDEKVFDIENYDVPFMNKTLSKVQASSDPKTTRMINGARRERSFRNVSSAITVLGMRGKIEMLDISFHAKPVVAIQRLEKFGISTYGNVDTLYVVVPKKSDHATEAFVFQAQNIPEVIVKFFYCDSIEEFYKLHSLAMCDDETLLHPPHVTEEEERMLEFLRLWPPSFSLTVDYGDSLHAYTSRNFAYDLSRTTSPYGCFILTAPNPALYTDPIYAASAGFVYLGAGSSNEHSETHVIFDRYSNRVFRDPKINWGNFVSTMAEYYMAVNFQRGSNISLPFPLFASVKNLNRYDDLQTIKYEGCYVTMVGWHFEVLKISPVNVPQLFAKENELKAHFKLPSHNKPEFTSLTDLRHNICDSGGLYFAPKIDGEKCQLLVYDAVGVYVLVFKGSKRYVKADYCTFPDPFRKIGKVSPTYIIQCEYVFEEGIHTLICIDILKGTSIRSMTKLIGNSLFDIADSCFESRYSALKDLSTRLGLPMQYYVPNSLDVIASSVEGFVIQPKLAPVNIVNMKKDPIRSASSAVKILSLDDDESSKGAAFLDSIDFSIDAYTELGTELFMHRLVELRIVRTNATTATLSIVGIKKTSTSSSISKVPNDVALFSDLESMNKIEQTYANPISSSFAWAHFAAVSTVKYITGVWKLNPPTLASLKRSCTRSEHKPGDRAECHSCELVRSYNEIKDAYSRHEDVVDEYNGRSFPLLVPESFPRLKRKHVDFRPR
jgi:hypothetical protein